MQKVHFHGFLSPKDYPLSRGIYFRSQSKDPIKAVRKLMALYPKEVHEGYIASFYEKYPYPSWSEGHDPKNIPVAKVQYSNGKYNLL